MSHSPTSRQSTTNRASRIADSVTDTSTNREVLNSLSSSFANNNATSVAARQTPRAGDTEIPHNNQNNQNNTNATTTMNQHHHRRLLSSSLVAPNGNQIVDLLNTNTTTSNNRRSSSSYIDVTRLSRSSSVGFQNLSPQEREEVLYTVADENERLRCEYDSFVQQSWFPADPLHVPVVGDDDNEYVSDDYHITEDDDQRQQQQQQEETGYQSRKSSSRRVGRSKSRIVESAVLARSSMRNPVNFKKSYDIRFEDTWKHLYLTISQRDFYLHIPTLVSQICIGLLLYAFAVLTIGDNFAPGGSIFDVLAIIVFSGVVGGGISVITGIPSLVCILFASIFWSNIGNGVMVSGVSSSVTSPIKVLGLTMILLRGGTSINLKILRPLKYNAICLAILPIILDIIAGTLAASHLFDYPNMSWAMLQASTLAPCSSSVVTTSVLYVQSFGVGNTGGPLTLLLSAVPLDSAFGIFTAIFMQRMVLQGESPISAVWMAPAQIIGGIVSGMVIGYLVEKVIDGFYNNRFNAGSHISPLLLFAASQQRQQQQQEQEQQNQKQRDSKTDENSKQQREQQQQQDFNRLDLQAQQDSVNSKTFWLILTIAATGMLCCKHLELEGAGSLFVVSFGFMLAERWNQDPKKKTRKLAFAMRAANIWNIYLCPALFACVGASVHLGQVFAASFFYKGLCCVFGSICARALGATIAANLFETDFSRKEKLVMAIGFTGKASSQASLALIVLDKATEKLATLTPGTDEYATWKKYQEYGSLIANASVLMIAIAAPLCSISMRILGKKYVRPDE